MATMTTIEQHLAQRYGIRVTDDIRNRLTVNGKPLSDVKPAPKASDSWPGYHSKWESLYAFILAELKQLGDIADWAYEPITFRLTDGSIVDGKKVRAITYTPDFVVWYASGKMECIEIKGYRRIKDINRFKLAKDKFRHIEWTMVKRTKTGWERMPY